MSFIALVTSALITILAGVAAAQPSARTPRASVADLRREAPEARPPGVAARAQVEGAIRAIADARSARAHGAPREDQLGALRKVADAVFDWDEMAKDALGEHWTRMTPAQRRGFARGLAQLFERVYAPVLDRPRAEAVNTDNSIVYLGETVRGDEVVVAMLWRRPGRDVAVDCSMRRRAGAWRIRDVALDGISMVENYRAQVNHVIQRASYDDLVGLMDARVHPGP